MKEFNLKLTFEKDTGTCNDCPLCNYDSYYDRQMDSGYDCSIEDVRIADDNQVEQWVRDKKESKRLPLLESQFTTPSPMTIPEWCPLEEISCTS